MLVVLLPRLLLFIACEPAAYARSAIFLYGIVIQR